MLEIPPLAQELLVRQLREAGCVFAEDEARLLRQAATTRHQLRQLAAARADGVPLEHLVGWAEFAGLRVPVRPGVFVPRHRTEHLLEVAAGLARPGDVVVDLCCGSGAIARALHERVPGLVLHASDVLPEAVLCARATLAGIGQVHLGDLYAALPGELRGRVDVLVANVPYVPTSAIALMPREAREHVAPVTVDGGTDGLDVLRRVAVGAPTWLAPGGYLLSEVAEDQLATALDVLRRAGLEPSSSTDEDLDATVVLARRPDPTSTPTTG